MGRGVGVSNIFMYSKTPHFQIHQSLFKDGLKRKMKPNATDLYLFVMYEAQRYSTSIVSTTTAKVLDATGISESRFAEAREQLEELGLVRWERDKDGWLFYIDVGVTWKGLDFDTFTPDEVKKYFVDRTKDDKYTEDGNNGLWMRCPFHFTSKERQRSLSVKLIDDENTKGKKGQRGIGVWRCNNRQCKDKGRSGRLVDFEQQLMAENSVKRVTIEAAHRSVANFFASLRAGKLDVDVDKSFRDEVQVMLDGMEYDEEFSTP